MKLFVAHDKKGNIRSFFSTASSSGSRVQMRSAEHFSVSEVEVPLEGEVDDEKLHRIKEQFQVDLQQDRPQLVSRKKS